VVVEVQSWGWWRAARGVGFVRPSPERQAVGQPSRVRTSRWTNEGGGNSVQDRLHELQ